jgi:hypothetical protein
MKQRLARDPRHVLNIYTCVPSSAGLPPGQILLGFAYLPFMAVESSYLHGVILHPSARGHVNRCVNVVQAATSSAVVSTGTTRTPST